MRDFFGRYRELAAYGVCGVLSTLVNIGSYQFLAHYAGLHYMLSNALAWVLAFLFAYWSNSRFVFGCPAFGSRGCLGRFLKFLGSRAFTGLLDMALMWLLVDLAGLQDSLAKVGVNILVIVLNYVMSKCFVFRGGRR